jgi:DNA-binding NtrC family response regulator
MAMSSDPPLKLLKSDGWSLGTMAEQINALLVHAWDETFLALAQTLGSLNINVIQARNCREAAHQIKAYGGLDLVFAGTNLQDGVWVDVLELAQQSKKYLPVIVISRMVDGAVYLDALGRGAFDFVTPPFLASDLAHIVRSAVYKELVRVKQDLAAPPAV